MLKLQCIRWNCIFKWLHTNSTNVWHSIKRLICFTIPWRSLHVFCNHVCRPAMLWCSAHSLPVLPSRVLVRLSSWTGCSLVTKGTFPGKELAMLCYLCSYLIYQRNYELNILSMPRKAMNLISSLIWSWPWVLRNLCQRVFDLCAKTTLQQPCWRRICKIIPDGLN